MKSMRRGITRRDAIGKVALFGLGLGAGVGIDGLVDQTSSGLETATEASPTTVPFTGIHQAGVVTPPPEFVNFAAFDLDVESLDALRELMQEWTAAAIELTAGRSYASPRTGEGIVDGPGREKYLGHQFRRIRDSTQPS